MVYPEQWSPISCKSSEGQRKFTGQTPAFYQLSHATNWLLINFRHLQQNGMYKISGIVSFCLRVLTTMYCTCVITAMSFWHQLRCGTELPAAFIAQTTATSSTVPYSSWPVWRCHQRFSLSLSPSISFIFIIVIKIVVIIFVIVDLISFIPVIISN